MLDISYKFLKEELATGTGMTHDMTAYDVSSVFFFISLEDADVIQELLSEHTRPFFKLALILQECTFPLALNSDLVLQRLQCR